MLRRKSTLDMRNIVQRLESGDVSLPKLGQPNEVDLSAEKRPDWRTRF